MKRGVLAFTTIVVIASLLLLSGCSNKQIKQLESEGIFANSIEDAILQTDIAGIVNSHFSEVSNVKKKALLLTIDGMRAEVLKYIYKSDLGMSKISKDGGLYWTTPANLDTKAKIDVGVNFLSIVTGEEPSSFGVLKSTDPKRATPYSLMGNLSERYSVRFLTDNENYIDIQLASEFKEKQSQKLTWSNCSDVIELRKESLRSLNSNDFIAVACSGLIDIAKGNFNLSNKEYFASMITLSYTIANIYDQVMARTNEDWLFLVASTCGGNNKLALNKETGNVLTFMISNKKIAIK